MNPDFGSSVFGYPLYNLLNTKCNSIKNYVGPNKRENLSYFEKGHPNLSNKVTYIGIYQMWNLCTLHKNNGLY